MNIPDTYSRYSIDNWGSPLYEWIEKDGDDDTKYDIAEVVEVLNEQAKRIAELEAQVEAYKAAARRIAIEYQAEIATLLEALNNSIEIEQAEQAQPDSEE